MLRRINKFLLINTIMALSCSSCSEDSFGPYRYFINNYESYDEMIDHLGQMNERAQDGFSQYYFDFHMDGYATSYFVGGADSCLALGYIESFDEHPNRCDYLIARQVYYELSKEDEVATITFRAASAPKDLNNLSWNSTSYLSYLSNETNVILRLNFNDFDIDEDTIISFQDSLIQSVVAYT